MVNVTVPPTGNPPLLVKIALNLIVLPRGDGFGEESQRHRSGRLIHPLFGGGSIQLAKYPHYTHHHKKGEQTRKLV